MTIKPEAHGQGPDSWPGSLEAVLRCPACGDPARSLAHEALVDNLFGAPGTWSMWRCSGCGSGYLDPRPDEASMALAYHRYYTHEIEPSALDMSLSGRLRHALGNDVRKRRYGYDRRPALLGGELLVRLIPALGGSIDVTFRFLPGPGRGRRLLDVGCGDGPFIKLARDAGWSVTGIDPDSKARERAASAGLDVRRSFDDLRSSERFDALTLNHVIEHVHSPRATLRRCHELLRSGGFLYLETPNMDAFGHQIWGGDWRGLEPPRHLTLFTPASLDGLLDELGFVAIYHMRRPNPFADLDRQSAELRATRDPAAPLPIKAAAADIAAAAEGAKREFLTVTARRP